MLVDEDVVGLEVAVHDPLRMEVGEAENLVTHQLGALRGDIKDATYQLRTVAATFILVNRS